MRNIYLDIETIPSQLPWVSEYVAAGVCPPGNMKKPETIAKWVEEEKASVVAEALDKCAFDGAMNHIVCIGIAIDDDSVETYTGEEKAILEGLKAALGGVGFDAKFIGHNIAGFDLRVLKQRSMVLGVKPHVCVPFDAKPWDNIRVYDTMSQWDGQNKAKLDKLAKAFGIDGKTMDGSMVYQMWKDGKIAEIAAYCAADVELTRKVYRRMQYGV